MLVRESPSQGSSQPLQTSMFYSSSAPLQKPVYSRNMKPAQPTGNMALNSPTRNTRTPRVPETGALGMSHCRQSDPKPARVVHWHHIIHISGYK